MTGEQETERDHQQSAKFNDISDRVFWSFVIVAVAMQLILVFHL